MPAPPAPSLAAAMGSDLRHLELRIPTHVPEHVHADALIEHLLQLFGK